MTHYAEDKVEDMKKINRNRRSVFSKIESSPTPHLTAWGKTWFCITKLAFSQAEVAKNFHETTVLSFVLILARLSC